MNSSNYVTVVYYIEMNKKIKKTFYSFLILIRTLILNYIQLLYL